MIVTSGTAIRSLLSAVVFSAFGSTGTKKGLNLAVEPFYTGTTLYADPLNDSYATWENDPSTAIRIGRILVSGVPDPGLIT